MYNHYMPRPRRIKKNADLHSYRFDMICENKRFFKTEQEALDAADFRMLEYMSVQIGVYHCTNCRNWHLTSLKES